MNKNKIIANIFKKLLIKKFTKEDIKELLFCYHEFHVFENFIFYLFQLAKKNDSSLASNMCASISSYLSYLVDFYFITQYDLSILEENKFYHSIEIKALSEHIRLINLSNENDFEVYKNIIFVNRIFPINSNYHIFINNQYYGKYNSLKYTNYFVKDLQIYASILMKNDNCNNYHWNEINNLIIAKYWTSLNQLKTNMIALLNQCKVIDNTLYDNIYNSTNHFSCFNNFIHYLFWTKNDILYNCFYEKYKNYLDHYQFSINMLFNDISIVNSYELVLLSNGYEILMGNNISLDITNNIYLVIDSPTYEKNLLLLDFFLSKNDKYFDNTFNKIILSSLNHQQKVYIFHKKKNDHYLFLGTFRTKGIAFKEKNNKLFPYFKLQKIPPEINFENKHIANNKYVNVFYEKMRNDQCYSLLSNQNKSIPICEFDYTNDLFNSLLYKYNWAINKYIITNDFNYALALQKFDTKLINNIASIVEKKYLYLFENKVIKNWALCTDIYYQSKKNINLDLIYFDSDIAISKQNELIAEFFKNNSF